MKKVFQQIRTITNTFEKGFTMIELLLYMGLLSILLMVLMQMFTSMLSVHAESQSTSSVDQDANYILSRMAYDIHNASVVDSPALGSSGTSLHITGSSTDITYSLEDDNLFLKNDVQNTKDRLNGHNSGCNVAFTTIGNSDPDSRPTVKVTLTLTSRTKREGGRLQTQVFETTVQTR